MRLTLSLVVGAAVAALGALILGEYEFDWLLTGLGGPLVGVVIAEVVTAVGGRRGWVPAVAAAGFAAGALAWAAWITSGQGLEPYPPLAWLAMGLAAAAALVWAMPRRQAGAGAGAGGGGGVSPGS